MPSRTCITHLTKLQRCRVSYSVHYSSQSDVYTYSEHSIIARKSDLSSTTVSFKLSIQIMWHQGIVLWSEQTQDTKRNASIIRVPTKKTLKMMTISCSETRGFLICNSVSRVRPLRSVERVISLTMLAGKLPKYEVPLHVIFSSPCIYLRPRHFPRRFVLKQPSCNRTDL